MDGIARSRQGGTNHALSRLLLLLLIIVFQTRQRGGGVIMPLLLSARRAYDPARPSKLSLYPRLINLLVTARVTHARQVHVAHRSGGLSCFVIAS